MKILITNHWLKKLGGSETFTYTLGKELLKQGHQVHGFTNHKGLISNRMEKEGIPFQLDDSYDLILANHNTTVDKVYGLGKIIQTCHGTIPKLEQPNHKADSFVAISEEVHHHLRIKYGLASTVIRNGIDCNRFKPTQPLNNRLKKVLSLCHTEEANSVITEACKILGLQLTTINKHQKQIWNIENHINQTDLVVTLGRGAYESFACGRPVVVFDKRPYQACYADGYVNETSLKEIITTNCSGRYLMLKMDPYMLAAEFKKYNPYDGEYLRNYAVKNLNIETQVQQYLRL